VHQAHLILLHPSSFSLSSSFFPLPPENNDGAMNGREFYITFCFNSSSKGLLNTTTILLKQSIEGINKGREKD
jgi:hypothetical protein